ncbi:hypothetical protein Hanom_Chr12g01089391 [Helianthus anomalus]
MMLLLRRVRGFEKLKMDSRMLCFRCCFNVLVVFDCFCFLDGLGCLKLDCIEIFLCWTWAGCGFSLEYVFFIYSLAHGRGLVRF